MSSFPPRCGLGVGNCSGDGRVAKRGDRFWEGDSAGEPSLNALVDKKQQELQEAGFDVVQLLVKLAK